MPADLSPPASFSIAVRDNPFPGLRPFEAHESELFFGRDEQCDDLLSRLSRRRLVAVVGASGSGKSSLVRAGLLPALRRGYLASAGSVWQIVTFRPGGNPIDNLVAGLADSIEPEYGPAPMSRSQLTETVSATSRGLVEAASRLLRGSQRSLLVLADQFEEIFRYRSLGTSAESAEEGVECINLLLAAAAQDDVPIYVVLTMRSDYLGDCARFAGLPEALNDSQFLVPRMTRDQLREAIEGPVAVGGARIAPALVQRVLFDVDAIAGRIAHTGQSTSDEYDHDQLPVVQHALMRVWEVSADARTNGGAIELEHYEKAPVKTIHHALDLHAEEIYDKLPGDYHRDVARLVFQRLTERDAENREVRRPTHLDQLVAVVAGGTPPNRRGDAEAAVRRVLEDFGGPGRAFVIVNAQQQVDIAHESFIRKWNRLRQWVIDEARSRRLYLRLAETASQWEKGEASLYRGPELTEADRWWTRTSPSAAWAARYDERLPAVGRFLSRSRRRRQFVFTAMAAGAIATVLVAVLMTLLWRRAVTAEEDARTARDGARVESEKNKQALEYLQASVNAAQAGNAELAEKLRLQSNAAAQQANQQNVFTPGELREIDTLKKTVADLTGEVKTLRGQLQTARDQLTAANTQRDQLQAKLDSLAKASPPANPNDDRVAALTRERDEDRKTYAAALQKLQSENADLKSRVSEPGGSTAGTDPKPEPGSPEPAFRAGVRAYDLRQYLTSVGHFLDAVAARPKPGLKEVGMSGTRFVPFAPNSYLAAALFEIKADCSVLAGPLKQSQSEPKAPDVVGKLESARKQCGTAP